MSEKKEGGWIVLIVFLVVVFAAFGIMIGYELGKSGCEVCQECKECPVVVERNCIKEKNCIEDCLDFIYYTEGLE